MGRLVKNIVFVEILSTSRNEKFCNSGFELESSELNRKPRNMLLHNQWKKRKGPGNYIRLVNPAK